MNEDIQNESPESENELIAPFEGKLDISHVVSVIMDHIGGIVRIPAEKFTSSMTVDRKLIIEYDNESRDFIVTIEQGLVGKEEIEVE